LMFM